jgi:SAM-dependent methyltransferase
MTARADVPRVTGERAPLRPISGFNPAWQRHSALYRLSAGFLGPGRVLDLGCGVGHSFALLGDVESVGVDNDPDALAGQQRETVVADMRDLPFADASFSAVVALHSVEHVANPALVVGEAARVLAPDGVALFATPNRLTFGRPDEIIDPYHYVELDPAELRDVCRTSFAKVEVLGLFGSERYLELFREERATLDRLLRLDPLRLRRLVPRRLRQSLYDALLRHHRPAGDARADAIDAGDFELRSEAVEQALDLLAVCRSPDPATRG